MKKILIFLIIVVFTLILNGCEEVISYESDHFKLETFNATLGIVGYKDGYFDEDLYIENEQFFNPKTKLDEFRNFDWIGYHAFQNIGLVSVAFDPNSTIYEIDSYAFADNENLNMVWLPSSIEYIGSSVFENCSDTFMIYINSTEPPTLGDNVFRNIDVLYIIVPEEFLSIYLESEEWVDYATHIYSSSEHIGNLVS